MPQKVSMKRYLNPCNDAAFKKIFGTVEHQACLISFLNSVLELTGLKEIQTVKFLDPYQAPLIDGKKISFIDVLCTDQRGIFYIVEMQIMEVESFEKRVQYYASKTYVSQQNRGEAYPRLNQVLFLAICNYELFPSVHDKIFSIHLKTQDSGCISCPPL